MQSAPPALPVSITRDHVPAVVFSAAFPDGLVSAKSPGGPKTGLLMPITLSPVLMSWIVSDHFVIAPLVNVNSRFEPATPAGSRTVRARKTPVETAVKDAIQVEVVPGAQ